MSNYVLIIVGLIVMGSIAVESVVGFGAAVLAVPFLSLFINVKSAIALMPMMSFLLSIYVFFTNRRYICRPVLKWILLFCGLGMPLGIVASSLLPERTLKLILGSFITFSALKAFVSLLRKNSGAPVSHELHPCTWPYRILLFLGGIFHGAFACGGSLITMYVNRQHFDKSTFRATMTSVWLSLNIVLFCKNIFIEHIITRSFMKMWLICIPFMVVGVAVGNFLHKKVSLRLFSFLTCFMLLAAGLSMLILQLI